MTAARIAGLLTDEARLRVFAAVALGARSVDDVARSAGLGVAEVQSALPRLVAAGLLEQEDGLRVQVSALDEAARDRPPRRRELPGATPEQADVLRNFVEEGRLTSLPARASRRCVVLEYLAGRFETGVAYDEDAVNETLAAFHPDYATLRRYLVDAGLLERAGGVYRRRAAD
jgi:hypothetical protein